MTITRTNIRTKMEHDKKDDDDCDGDDDKAEDETKDIMRRR